MSLLHHEERALVESLLRTGLAPAQWRRLIDLKLAVGATEDALEAWVEAFWQAGGEVPSLREQGVSLFSLHLGLTGDPDRDFQVLRSCLWNSDSSLPLLALVFCSVGWPPSLRTEACDMALETLQGSSDSLPRKHRWLVLEAVVEHRPSLQEERERSRRALLRELHESHELHDIPGFVKGYLRASSSSAEQGADTQSRQQENLRLLSAFFAPLLQAEGTRVIAAIACAYVGFGFAQRECFLDSEAHCDRALSALESLSPREQAFVLQVVVETLRDPYQKQAYRERYRQLCRDLVGDQDFLHELERLEQGLLARRVDEDGLLDSLAKENLQRLEPPQSRDEEDQYTALWEDLQRGRAEDDLDQVLRNLCEGFVQAGKELEREKPRLNRLFQVLRGWFGLIEECWEGPLPPELVRQVEAFHFAYSQDPPERLNAMQVCYFFSLQLRLSRFLLQRQRPDLGLPLLEQVFVAVQLHELFPVDFIDLAGLGLSVLPLVPLEQRGAPLQTFLESVRDQLTGKYSFYYQGNDSFLPWFINTIDQLVQCSVHNASAGQEILDTYRTQLGSQVERGLQSEGVL